MASMWQRVISAIKVLQKEGSSPGFGNSLDIGDRWQGEVKMLPLINHSFHPKQLEWIISSDTAKVSVQVEL